MIDVLLLIPIVIPFIMGILVLPFKKKVRTLPGIVTLIVAVSNLALSIILYNDIIILSIPMGGFGFDFSLRLFHFNSFILCAAAGFAFLVALYSIVFMHEKHHINQFYSYLLITLSFVNGAILADSLFILLLFWEGLLATLFGMIAIGSPGGFRTGAKAFMIVGASDLCMMFGIALTSHLSGTLEMSQIHLPLKGAGIAAFILLMIGATAKAGSMPFHSWIPDASQKAHLPFMAFLPAALEKLLGIYLLSRICLDMFILEPSSPLSFLLMIIGSITILAAVLMALIQKEYKKLLSYHAISQVGYMILGIGTALPIGIIGGLFHMINHAMYKSCLFLTGGAVELQTGTTDLEDLGGLKNKMPITFGCFIIAAAAISGVPPFNGFFSKELIYDAALERGAIFYIVALLGSFFTAASFLKLGHSAFLGKAHERFQSVKEAPAAMLIPMIILASLCVFFGLWNSIPLNEFIRPILAESGIDIASVPLLPSNTMLIAFTVVVLAGALFNHIAGYSITRRPLKSVEHIHTTPGLSRLFAIAEKESSDVYELGKIIIRGFSSFLYRIDRIIDRLYSEGTVVVARYIADEFRILQTGNYATYIVMVILSGLVIMLVLLKM